MLSRFAGRVIAVCAGLGLSAVGYAQGDGSPAATTPVEVAQSQVRIVRVSQVRGVVRLDRNTGKGFEPAFANIPVVSGARLMTGAGIAEVEFEDNSSLRLVPDSEVQFKELSRTGSGGTITTVSVGKGVAYVSLEKTKGNVFALSNVGARVVLTPGTHLRLDAREPEIALAVFEGQATLELGGTTTLVGKHQTLELNPTAQTVSTLAQRTEEEDFDAWDKQEQDYHRRKASFALAGGSGLYGSNDLNYYGAFAELPGCGNVWRPYFADAAWDPFGSGVWTWYPAAGYSWVSPYPWGWLPYHSGSWVSCGNAGWGWQPGGAWYGLNNAVMLRTATRIPKGPLPHPVPPGPGRNGTTLVPVNMKALPVSGLTSGERFAFRQNSAGLGVPRGDYGNLRGTAMHVERSGVAMHGVEMSSTVHETFSAPRGVGGGRETGAGRMSGFAGAPSHSSFTGSSGASSAGTRGGSVSMSSAGTSSSMSSGSSASGRSSASSAGAGGRH